MRVLNERGPSDLGVAEAGAVALRTLLAVSSGGGGGGGRNRQLLLDSGVCAGGSRPVLVSE